MKLRLINNNRKRKEREKKIKIVTCPMGKEEKNQQIFCVFIWKACIKQPSKEKHRASFFPSIPLSVTVCHHVMSRVTVIYSSSAHLCLLYFFSIRSPLTWCFCSLPFLPCSPPCWYTSSLSTFLSSSAVSSTSVWFLRKCSKKKGDWSVILQCFNAFMWPH